MQHVVQLPKQMLGFLRLQEPFWVGDDDSEMASTRAIVHGFSGDAPNIQFCIPSYRRLQGELLARIG
jgi:hypothetical protein